MKPRTTAELIVEIIASLSSGPKLRKQILIDIGISPSRTERIAVHLRGLRQGGLIRFAGWQDSHPLLEFQHPPFSSPDAPKPEVRKKHSPTATKRAAVLVLPARPASVFNQGA